MVETGGSTFFRGGRSFAESPKPIPNYGGPLRVTQARAVIPAKIAFQKIPRAHVEVDHTVHEIGVGVARENGMKNLVAAVNLHAKGVGEALGQGKRFVLAAPKSAVEFRVVQVRKHADLPQTPQG